MVKRRFLVILALALLLNGCDQTGEQDQSEIGEATSDQIDSSDLFADEEIPIYEIPVYDETVYRKPVHNEPVYDKPVLRDKPREPDSREIDWEVLVPADWQPENIIGDIDIENLSDDDPRAIELFEKMKELFKDAPVVPEFDGKEVKLPGFVVPLDMDARKIEEFLLVPYYGACIHVPPPPANQTIHVVTSESYRGELFDAVWVTGTMRIEHLSSELAEAGYRLENATVQPYE